MSKRRVIVLVVTSTALLCQGLTIFAVLKIAACILLFLYGILPLLFHYSSTVQRHIVFVSMVRYPFNVDFSRPEKQGLPATKNYYLESETGVNIGVWHVLPKSLMKEAEGKGDEFYEKSLTSGYPVILYMHGNSGTRAGPHRVELYQVLRNLDFHVICFDYRGYADSTKQVPTEDGVVRDGKFMYKWVKQRIGKVPLIVWGHSLGTGVSSRAVSELCLEGDPPEALVLESPFTNIVDEVRSHPLSYMYRRMPGFQWFFLQPLIQNNLTFLSDRYISNIHVPILMLHAKDDAIIPFHLGQKLYKAAMSLRPSSAGPVRLIPFDGKFGYGHKYICRAPELPGIIRDFVDSSVKHSLKNTA